MVLPSHPRFAHSQLKAIFFDVDGVLTDSLPQHLKICEDLSREFDLGLRIPNADAFRKMVASGVKVSPMRNFFLAVGFGDLADRAVGIYETQFMKRYCPPLFEGVPAMIRTLHDAGLHLGIVTSNTRDNVLASMGDLIRYFDPACLFFFDTFPARLTKAQCLEKGIAALQIEGSECLYVGDQPADAAAAAEAGVRFLGVTYGWGISRSSPFPVVNTVREIGAAVLNEASNLSVQG
jgi:phosphoglycolate phosphatase-like HAD superfamily hydrolase